MSCQFVLLTEFSTNQRILVGLRHIKVVRSGYNNGPGAIIQFGEDEHMVYRVDVVESFDKVADCFTVNEMAV
jgi:hypothetical protein